MSTSWTVGPRTPTEILTGTGVGPHHRITTTVSISFIVPGGRNRRWSLSLEKQGTTRQRTERDFGNEGSLPNRPRGETGQGPNLVGGRCQKISGLPT